MNVLKQIVQSDLGQRWPQDVCMKCGTRTKTPCVKLGWQNGNSALLVNADADARRENADAMIDFAELLRLKNNQAYIGNAIAFRKHPPRSAVNMTNDVVPSTLLERAPRNPELRRGRSGIVNAQLQGVDPDLFGRPRRDRPIRRP
ncbi:hypothetical protein BJV78DRAFT_1122936 [Lactifluus subvellereus]|nr:hypothetical protein BJV78DRAFT_1122936 [Lactifluus subvellereus]